MAAAELPRPGVEVIQEFRTVTPTVITPTLVPCVVGVAKQVVEALAKNSSGGNILNGDALIALPALLLAKAATGSPPKYTGLDGLSLKLSFNNGPLVTILFADATAAGLTPATMVTQILKAFETAGVTAATAETVGNDQFRIRSIGVGEFQSIYVDSTSSASALTALGIGAGKTYVGVGNYRQYGLDIPAKNFPDPRGNIDELSIEVDTIRAFLALGTGINLREFARTSAFLRNGQVDDAAAVTGNVNVTALSYPSAVQTQTMSIKVNGGTAVPVTITSGATTQSLFLAQLNAAFNPAGVTASVVSTFLVLTTTATGYATTLEIVAGGTLLSTVGLTAGVYHGKNIEVVDDGNGDIFSPLLKFDLEDFTATGTSAVRTGTVDLMGLTYPTQLNGKTLTLSDGYLPQTVTFVSPANMAAVLTQINAVFSPAAGGRLTATASGGNFLVLTNALTGAQSIVEVIGGTAVTILGLTVNKVYGGASKAAVGDELWVDGKLLATIIQVAPGGAVDTLKIDQNLAISSNVGTSFFIVAKGLSAVPAADRPFPELVVNGDGSVTLLHDVLRDVQGNALSSVNGRATIYLAYNAVRQDVSPRAKRAGLLRIDSTTQLENALSPVNSLNPLALGLFFALVNAPGAQVTGLGVDEITADAPFGTVEAFTKAAEFLEAFEVYAIAPLTQDDTVGQVFSTHVSFMSEPAQKGERIAVFNTARPANKLDTLVASGATGNSVGSGGTQFDTGIANLASLLLNAGVSPVGTIPATAGVYLDIQSSSNKYSIQTISGSIITIRTAFSGGENEDGYYSTTDLNDPPLPSILIDETFAIRIRGASLTNVDGTPDKQSIAETYQAKSQTFLNRRFWHTAPDSCAATIEGVEQVLPGFYLNAAIAGMIAQQPPQQSFTNYPMSGFTRVLGSNDFFSERQMNIMAAGGTYIIVQDSPGAPLISRMALTTDVTSVETRTDSITKVVDFTAKFLRRGLRNFIGRFNITQAFLDSLGTVINGMLGFLVENGILISGHLNNIVQDEDQPDTVLIDVLLDVPYPCNYIRLTLQI